MLGLAAGSAGAHYLAGGTTPRPPPTYRQLTFRNGSISGARFQSDGENIVYGAAWDGEPYRIHTTRLSSYQSSVRADLPAAALPIHAWRREGGHGYSSSRVRRMRAICSASRASTVPRRV